MGPGVVTADGYATNRSALGGEQQAVVAGCSSGLHFVDRTKPLSRDGIFKHQSAALIDIRRCRTGGVLNSIERAWTQPKKDRIIEWLGGPQMPGGISEVVRGDEPVGAKLLLNAKIPLTDPHVRSVIVGRRNDRKRRPRDIARQIRTRRYGKWISAGIRGPRRVELDVGLLHTGIPWRDGREISSVYCSRIIVERSGRHADGGSAVAHHIPCES